MGQERQTTILHSRQWCTCNSGARRTPASPLKGPQTWSTVIGANGYDETAQNPSGLRRHVSRWLYIGEETKHVLQI